MSIQVEFSSSDVILNWMYDNLWINVFIVCNLVFMLINISFVFKFFNDESKMSKKLYLVTSLLMCFVCITLLFINFCLFVLKDDNIELTDHIVNHNYGNIVIFSCLVAFAVIAFIFSTMYNSKPKDNKHWFICMFIFICLDLMALIALSVYNFLNMFGEHFGFYIGFIVFAYAILWFAIVENESKETMKTDYLFYNGFICVVLISIMFMYNFRGLLSNDNLSFVLNVNKTYYADKLVPNAFETWNNTLLQSMSQLQANINNYTDIQENIDENFICNSSIVSANTQYLMNLSNLTQLNDKILNFNQTLSNNIGNVDEINLLNQQILSSFNVAKNISKNYFINNFQYSNYFPDDISFVTWVYDIIASVQSSAYANVRQNYSKYYVLDGNFAVFNGSQSICESPYISIYPGMSLSSLMLQMGVNNISVNGNVVSCVSDGNTVNIGFISDLYSYDIWQNLFNFSSLNWTSNDVFAVTLVYNCVPYTFIFSGDASNSLVGVVTNNYLVHLFDLSTCNIYRVDFINKVYTLFKCFTSFNSKIYNSSNVSFSLKNNSPLVFFQSISTGFFDTISYLNNNVTYEFFNSNSGNMWTMDMGNVLFNTVNAYYEQYVKLMNANYNFSYKIYNKSDNISVFNNNTNIDLVSINTILT